MFDFFNRRRMTSQNSRDQFVHVVADRCVPVIRQRLTADTSRMGVAELRGYVRARAQRVVNDQVLQILKKRGLTLSVRDPLTAQALERTVHLVVRQLIVQPIGGLPAPACSRCPTSRIGSP